MNCFEINKHHESISKLCNWKLKKKIACVYFDLHTEKGKECLIKEYSIKCIKKCKWNNKAFYILITWLINFYWTNIYYLLSKIIKLHVKPANKISHLPLK